MQVRGFSLNTRGQNQLNFDLLKKNILDEITRPQAVPNTIPVFNPHKIVRDPNTKELLTHTEIKRYKLVFDKRIVDSTTFQSYPYGYKRTTMEEPPRHYDPLISLESLLAEITQDDSTDMYRGLLDGTLDIFQ